MNLNKKPKWGDRIPITSVSSTDDPEVTFYYSNDQQIEPLNVIDTLDINTYPKGEISYCWIRILEDELGNDIKVPVMIARGSEDGPILGITAAIHGNELQGIPTIHTVFRELKERLDLLKGTVVGVPCLNIPGYMLRQRRFTDGIDLNTIMPGNKDGTSSQQYAYNILDKIVSKFNYLIDLHTASKGRVNSFYIRADMKNSVVNSMATIF